MNTPPSSLHAKARMKMLMKALYGDLPGCAPVGYLNRRRGKKTWVEIDEEKRWLIELAFELAAEGKVSLRKSAEILNDLGLCSRNGKPLGVSALWSILTNPFYTGKLVYGGKVRPGNHPALVSEELWQKAQKGLAGRRRRPQGKQYTEGIYM